MFSMEESRIVENELDEENDAGFEMYECPASELPRVSEELSKMKKFATKYSTHYFSAIKAVVFPEEYYKKHDAMINRIVENYYDHKKSKLPSKIKFKKEERE